MGLFGGKSQRKPSRKATLASLEKREQVIRSRCNLELDKLEARRQSVKNRNPECGCNGACSNPHHMVLLGGAKLAAGVSSVAGLANPSRSPKQELLQRAQEAGYTRHQAETAWRRAGALLGVSKTHKPASGEGRLIAAGLILAGILTVHHLATSRGATSS